MDRWRGPIKFADFGNYFGFRTIALPRSVCTFAIHSSSAKSALGCGPIRPTSSIRSTKSHLTDLRNQFYGGQLGARAGFSTAAHPWNLRARWPWVPPRNRRGIGEPWHLPRRCLYSTEQHRAQPVCGHSRSSAQSRLSASSPHRGHVWVRHPLLESVRPPGLCLGSLRARNELSLISSIRYSEGRSFRCAGWVVQQRAQRIRRSPYPDNGYVKKCVYGSATNPFGATEPSPRQSDRAQR